jgi:hypothetical protein
LSAAEVLWELSSAGVELGAAGDRVRLVAPPGRLQKVLTPALRAEVVEVRPLLVLVAGGRWRREVEGWPSWWKGRWAEMASANQSSGLAPELAERLAFLCAAELPDEAAPVAPPAWRELVASWPESRREAWAERAAILEYGGGLAREQAEQRACADVGASVASPVLAPAPCPACGVPGQVAASGLGFCEGCGWVPRLEWEWS